MKFGYVIAYVDDVDGSMRFFERAFGFARKFLHPSGDYGELLSGETTIAFAAAALAAHHVPSGLRLASASDKPLGVEIALICEDVPAAHRRAIDAGARELAAPGDKPWGQTVSYVSTPDGLLIELCTPIAETIAETIAEA
jgi:lactoylglutathione lyase